MNYCVYDNKKGQIQTKLEIEPCELCKKLPAVLIETNTKPIWLCGNCISDLMKESDHDS